MPQLRPPTLARLVCGMLLLVVAACHSPTPQQSEGFYYWRTGFELDVETEAALCAHPVLYLRMFDVHRKANSPSPYPLATRTQFTAPSCGITVVPVVFITQQALKGLGIDQVDTLATQIASRVAHLCQKLGISYTQIQLDSDWTPSTRPLYFRLIERVRYESERAVSVTLRLHQTKDTLTNGIPPADRVLLMAYNLDDIRQLGTKNSILEPRTLQNYLTHLSGYPLPMDLALPIFGWGAHYRADKLIDLQAGMRAPADTGVFSKIRPDQWRAEKNGYFSGKYWYAGDVLKIEYPAQDSLLWAASFIRKNMPQNTDSLSILLYHLDAQNLALYPRYAEVFDRFR